MKAWSKIPCSPGWRKLRRRSRRRGSRRGMTRNGSLDALWSSARTLETLVVVGFAGSGLTDYERVGHLGEIFWN